MVSDIDRFRTLLTSRRLELQDLIDGAAESAAPVELDQQVQGRLSRMDALQGQAMAQATSSFGGDQGHVIASSIPDFGRIEAVF